MKKAIILLAIAVVVGFLLRYFMLYENLFFRSLNADEPISVFATADTDFIRLGADKSAEPFVIRGVIVDACIPGYFTSDFAATEAQYYTWLTQIADMGANTVNVYTIMDSEFYNAFARFNRERETPLYLLQGLTFPDYDLNNAKDAFGLLDYYLEHMKTMVNVIHGNELVALGRVSGSGNYLENVSEWTIGYVIGSEWTPYTVAYTDQAHQQSDSYVGEYYCASDDATATESLLAQMADTLMRYETERYRTQRLISFSNGLATDPLEYKPNVQLQLDKCARLNTDHIVPTDKTLSGCFAGYWMRAHITNFLDCLSDGDKKQYSEILSLVDPSGIYDGYVQFLTLLHDMPVVILNYGFSTARATDQHASSEHPQGRFTEREQGLALVEAYRGFLAAGCQGAVIGSWQDNWSRTTWNTLFSIDEEREQLWYDVQSIENCYGILSFTPLQEDSTVCYMDGNTDDWTGIEPAVTQNGCRLSAQYDAAYLYLLVQGAQFDAPLYIPLDVTPNSGSLTLADSDARFTRYADFLIALDTDGSAQMLVQQRYDAARVMYEERISGENPFYHVPLANTDVFLPIRNVLKVPFDASLDLLGMDQAQREAFRRYDTVETGRLRAGNANPNASQYDSLADYCYGGDCVEIRIPWQLLNLSDPSGSMAHADYYAHYGVQAERIDCIYIGAAPQSATEQTVMNAIPLHGWERILYSERLKQSYGIIQAVWKGDASA